MRSVGRKTESLSATFNAQGRNNDGTEWEARGIEFSGVAVIPAEDLEPTVTTVGSGANGDTVRLSVQLGADQANMYAIFGHPDSPMSLPAAYQSAAPFGVDIGGVAPDFVALSADAGTDSWLTVGYVDGFSGSDLMASPSTLLCRVQPKPNPIKIIN